ncbi:hypothetical protein [Luteimonas sp. R10]|uniref:hypothetical protein n=1 Tax=Luteimonas sp. R10 TaxID=3108176 RepID=UPI003085A95A|nr:hypothetical protein U3649_18660 [Luteimonas sp. R10]
MTITVYRVDGRSPEDIRDAGGFQPKGLHLDLPVARELVVRATLDATVAVHLPPGRGQSIRDWLGAMGPDLISINDLYVKVQSFGKDIDAFQVSTERGEDGGGQGGGGNVYRIDCPTPLYQWSSQGFRNAPVPTVVNGDQDLSRSQVNRCLLTNTAVNAVNNPRAWDARESVNLASIIALSSYSPTCSEIAFLNAIPYAWISGYRSGSGSWNPMPA